MARHRRASAPAARPCAAKLTAAARTAPALAAMLVAGALLTADAQAHTHLASTTPADGARTRAAPTAVVLRFTRAIDARTAALRVIDQQGRPVPIAARGGSGGVVRVSLRRPLANGDYAVGYRVLADDGHAMSGGLAFTVAARAGAAPGASRAATAALVARAVPGDASWTGPALIAARAGQYAGLVLALGGVTFLLLAWWPALAGASPGRRDPAAATRHRVATAGTERPDPAMVASRRTPATAGTARPDPATATSRRTPATAGTARSDPAAATWRRTLTVAVTIGAASAAAGLVVHAFDAAGAQPGAERVLRGLGDGAAILWIEAAACWLVAAVLLRRAPRLDPRAARRLLAPLAGALLATALSGHGGAGANMLAAAAAIVHGTAAAIWIGALAWLVLAARRCDERGEVRAVVLPAAAARVSRLSLAAALATLASGTIQAIALAGGPLTLPGSSYGRLVLVKLALFGGLVALGIVHRRRTLPVLRRGRGTTTALRATLRAELAIAALVLGTASALTGAEPPRRPGDAPAPAALAAGR